MINIVVSKEMFARLMLRFLNVGVAKRQNLAHYLCRGNHRGYV